MMNFGNNQGRIPFVNLYDSPAQKPLLPGYTGNRTPRFSGAFVKIYEILTDRQ